MTKLKSSVLAKVNKNVDILQLSSQICRKMRGLRFTSCKSAKDRTGMSITLEQVNILAAEYHLAEDEIGKALDCMRRWGHLRFENEFYFKFQNQTFPNFHKICIAARAVEGKTRGRTSACANTPSIACKFWHCRRCIDPLWVLMVRRARKIPWAFESSVNLLV